MNNNPHKRFLFVFSALFVLFVAFSITAQEKETIDATEKQVEKIYESLKDQVTKQIKEEADAKGITGEEYEELKKQALQKFKHDIRQRLKKNKKAEAIKEPAEKEKTSKESEKSKKSDRNENSKKSSLEQKADEVLENLATLRGLKKKRDVAVAAMDRESLYQYMLKDFNKQVIDSDIKKLDLLGGRMGSQPENVDTKKVYLNLLKQGVAGFYDPTTKKYYLIQQADKTNYDEATLAHELTHALQDQYYDLMSLPMNVHDNSDIGTALKCVIEGDAKYTELLYMKKHLNKDDTEEWLRKEVAGQGMYLAGKPGGMYIDPKLFGIADEDFFSFILGKMLMYSYYEGARFVEKVYKKGGWDAVNHLYEDWPLSTEQIIHPEKFLNKETRDDPAIINAKAFIDWTDNQYDYILSDVIGELGIDRLLINFFNRKTLNAEEAGAGWEGDRVVGLINHNTKKPVYVWLSLWETEKDAEEFEKAMTMLYQKHFSKPNTEKNYPKEVVASKGETVSWIQRQGKKILICDGDNLANTKTLIKQAIAKTKITEMVSKDFWKTPEKAAEK